MHGPGCSAERRDAGPKTEADKAEERSYWRHRMQKLCQRDTEGHRASYLFEHIRVYFNGYMEGGDVGELQDLVRAHGGRITPYVPDKHTTHIIATSLSATKRQARANKRSLPAPVVHPAWIIDSIEVGSLQPAHRYGLRGTVVGASEINQFLATRDNGSDDEKHRGPTQEEPCDTGEVKTHTATCAEHGSGVPRRSSGYAGGGRRRRRAPVSAESITMLIRARRRGGSSASIVRDLPRGHFAKKRQRS